MKSSGASMCPSSPMAPSVEGHSRWWLGDFLFRCSLDFYHGADIVAGATSSGAANRNMTGVKPEARPVLDHLRDPRQGPQVGRKPVGRGPAPECQIDPGQLPGIQTRLAAQPAGRLQPPARPARAHA